MKKFFKLLLAVTGVLVIGVVLLLYNPGLIRGPIETYLGEASGYSISLEGDLKIGLGKQLAIDVSDIRIANPEQDSGQNLVTLDRLKLILITATLFEDRLVIERLDLNKLQTNLATSEDGTGNWETTREPQTPNEDNKPGPAVILKDIQINDSTLSYQNGRRGHTQRLHINSFRQSQNSKGMLHINLDGSFNDRPVEYEGEIGSFANILTGQDISFSGSGRFGDLNITGEGLIDDLAALEHPQFNLQMEGPEIDEITAMLGFEDFGSGGFSLNARGEVVNNNYIAGIHGKIGDLSLSVSAQASSILALDDVELELATNGPSLGALTRSFGIEGWPDSPFNIKGKAQRVGTTLNVSNLTLVVGGSQLTLDALLSDFPALDASRIKLSLRGDDIVQFRELLGIRGIATGPFEALGSLNVSADGVELIQVSLRTSLGQATLSGTLGPAPAYTGTKLHVNLDGKDAHALVSAFGIDALPEQPFSLDTHVELIENGLQIERGVLVTIDDDRLELGGLIAFNPGGSGSNFELEISGQDLAQMLRGLVGDFALPARPYTLGGRVRLLEEGVELQNVTAAFEDIKLAANGLVRMDKQFVGSSFDFQIEGENLSSLENFPAIGDSLNIFVPGQAYLASGRFDINAQGWRLDSVNGQLGKTSFAINGLISPLDNWSGSSVRFSTKGPGLNTLIIEGDESDLPHGAFEADGQLALSDDQLTISGFNFETVRAKAKVDLEIAWPVSKSADVIFDVLLQGDDIRQLLPRFERFKPAQTAFNITSAGQKQGSQISLRQFETTIGNLRVSLKGKVDDNPSDEDIEIAFEATSNDLSTLGQLDGEPLPAMALNLKADFKGNAVQFKIQNLSGELGENKLTGSLDVSLQDPRPKINLVAHSDYIDIRPFIGSADTDDEIPEAVESDLLIPATPLPLDALAALDASIRLQIDELRHKNDSLKNIVLDAKLDDGKLDVPQLQVDGPEGNVRYSLTLNPTSPGKADVTLDLRAAQFVMNLTGQPADKLDKVPAADIIFNASGNGGDLRELAGSLNGSLYMGSAGGTLEGVNLSVLDTFILDEIFSLIMPKSDQDDDLNLTCAALIVKIKDGMMTTDPALAFTTSKITVISKGTLDLKTEKMNFNFNATPNNALKISAGELFNPYILVGGTLSKPAVGLDPGKVILHGGAAIGTAGISILAKGLIDRVSTTIPLCDEMLKTVQQQQ